MLSATPCVILAAAWAAKCCISGKVNRGASFGSIPGTCWWGRGIPRCTSVRGKGWCFPAAGGGSG
eukprot:4500266-Alexandrium_andersonii.AAC.1